MTESTIKLISPEEMTKAYWNQYRELLAALNQTVNVLRAMGETQFPGLPSGTSVYSQTAPAPVVAIPPASQTPAEGGLTKPVSLSIVAREGCEAIKTGITVERVAQYITARYPGFDFIRKSLRSIISQMAADKKLVLVKRGENSNEPSVYDLPDDPVL